MQPEPVEAEQEVLPYRTPAPKAATNSAGTLGGFSLLCIAVPLVGFAVRNGLMFVAGLPLSFVGAALGIGAIVSSAKASSVSALGVIGTVGNALGAAYFVWLFAVRGLC